MKINATTAALVALANSRLRKNGIDWFVVEGFGVNVLADNKHPGELVPKEYYANGRLHGKRSKVSYAIYPTPDGLKNSGWMVDAVWREEDGTFLAKRDPEAVAEVKHVARVILLRQLIATALVDKLGFRKYDVHDFFELVQTYPEEFSRMVEQRAMFKTERNIRGQSI